MDEKTKQLVNDLSHSHKKYESLITEYFNTFDIDSLGLTYDNFESDIKKVVNFIKHTLDHISNIDNKKIKQNLKKINYIFNIKKYNAIQSFFDNTEYFINNSNLLTKLQNYITKQRVSKVLTNVKQYYSYLEKNKLLYTSYYNIFYIYIFINNNKLHSTNNIALGLLLTISNKYLTNATKNIYDYQLHVESYYESNENDSKKIIDLLYNDTITSLELYDKINNNPSLYFTNTPRKKIKKQIQLIPIQKDINNKSINLPKFININLQDSMLTKTFGLCNIDLYNLINTSSLPICYNNKKFFTLNNDIKFFTREEDSNMYKLEDTTINNETNNNNIEELLITYILKYLKYFCKGYLIVLYDNNIYFSRNAIYNIIFSNQEYKTLELNINSCMHQYICVYCAQIPFKKHTFFNNVIKPNFKGGHRLSLIFDTINKKIILFDPAGINDNEYLINDINKLNVPIITLMLALELNRNINFNHNYEMLYYYGSLPQNIEHNFDVENKLYNYNIKQIFNPEKKKLRDWAGGYCGL